ncbi:unnamed protein product, partial [Trichobilharzia regenti]
NDPISHHPCTNNGYIHHIIRLRALWKYGLPDSLESLLLCRINEHILPLMMNKLSCERYSEYINPSDTNKKIFRTNSTVITTTPTVSRPVCTLSSSTINKTNISELSEKSDRIISVNQSSESSCPICDNKDPNEVFQLSSAFESSYSIYHLRFSGDPVESASDSF